MNKYEPYIFNGMYVSKRINNFKHLAKKFLMPAAFKPAPHPRCQDGSLDKRFFVNNGLLKYGCGGGKIIGKKDLKKNQAAGPVIYLTGFHQRCKDLSLDMRYKINRGLHKYGNYIFQ